MADGIFDVLLLTIEDGILEVEAIAGDTHLVGTPDKSTDKFDLFIITDIEKDTATAEKLIDAFLQQDPEEGLAVSPPEANAYELKSGGVAEMFKKLLDNFIEERTTLEKEEMNSKHTYDMLMQDFNSQGIECGDFGEDRFKIDTTKSVTVTITAFR